MYQNKIMFKYNGQKITFSPNILIDTIKLLFRMCKNIYENQI